MSKKKLHLSANAPPVTPTTVKLRNTATTSASVRALNGTTGATLIGNG